MGRVSKDIPHQKLEAVRAVLSKRKTASQCAESCACPRPP
jgi:hypothetical protein